MVEWYTRGWMNDTRGWIRVDELEWRNDTRKWMNRWMVLEDEWQKRMNENGSMITEDELKWMNNTF